MPKGLQGFQKGNDLGKLNKGKEWPLCSEETRRKIKEAQYRRKERDGYINSPETRKNMSLARMGNKNPDWKGNKVKYPGVHQWLRKNKPKVDFCELCGKKTGKLDLSNISGEHTRDADNYNWYCRKCHVKRDRISRFFKDLGIKHLT